VSSGFDYASLHPNTRYLIDGLQSYGKCCGAERGHTDWRPAPPTSCCESAKSNRSMAKKGETCDHIYPDGCISPLQMTRYKIYSQAIVVVLVLALLTLMIIACCMERDAQLAEADLINQQYAAHLYVCNRMGASAQDPSASAALVRKMISTRRYSGLPPLVSAGGPVAGPPPPGNWPPVAPRVGTGY